VVFTLKIVHAYVIKNIITLFSHDSSDLAGQRYYCSWPFVRSSRTKRKQLEEHVQVSKACNDRMYDIKYNEEYGHAKRLSDCSTMRESFGGGCSVSRRVLF
jgi:hypothetical protein